jgi:hypothetical protein
MENGPTLLWLASRPVAETNWPLDRSFVLYFSDLLNRAFPAGSESTVNAAGAVDWRREDLPIPPAETAAEIPLTWPLGLLAIVLLMAASALLVRRSAG